MAPNYLVEKEGKESTVAIRMRILDCSKVEKKYISRCRRIPYLLETFFYFGWWEGKTNAGEEPLSTDPGWLSTNAATV